MPTDPHEDARYADAMRTLAWRVAHNAGRRSPSAARWVHVKRATGLGAGFSQRLCRDAGVDPDEVTGNEDLDHALSWACEEPCGDCAGCNTAREHHEGVADVD